MSAKRQITLSVAAGLLVILVASTSGCAGEEAAPIGDPEAGKVLYELGPEGVYAPNCVTCHRLSDVWDRAPGFKGIAERAATRVPGLSAEEYLRQSIMDPEAYTVEGDWVSGPMPTNYAEEYSEEDINNLIAFLLTQ